METKEILNEFLKSLLEGVKQAGAFVKEQLPLVLQEYVKWGAFEGIIWVAFGIAGLFAAWKLWIACIHPGIKKEDADKHGDSMGWYMVAFLTVLPIVIFSALGIINGALQATKTIIAPRVYLIEELSKLVQ